MLLSPLLLASTILHVSSTVTIFVFGKTGQGKSENGNAFLQKNNAFLASSDPQSCTNKTESDFNIVNGVMRYYIDTPGLESTYGNDLDIIMNIVNSLNTNNTHGINAFFLVIGIDDIRLTPNIKNMIKALNDLFIDSDCWKQAGIIFTKCNYNDDEIDNKIESGKKYRNEVITFIKTLPKCQNIDIQLPCFFVNCKKWMTDKKTQAEYERILKFAEGFIPTPYNFSIPAIAIEESQDSRKVQEKIYKKRKPDENNITIFAYGKYRNFSLDENGKVIVPVTISLTQLYEFRYNWEGVEYEKTKIDSVSVKYDFERMLIYPIVEDQRLGTFIYHRKRKYWYEFGHVRRKTSRYSQELIIDLGGGFVFKDTNSSRYVLRSPNHCPIYELDPKAPKFKELKITPVPTSIEIFMD